MHPCASTSIMHLCLKYGRFIWCLGMRMHGQEDQKIRQQSSYFMCIVCNLEMNNALHKIRLIILHFKDICYLLALMYNDEKDKKLLGYQWRLIRSARLIFPQFPESSLSNWVQICITSFSDTFPISLSLYMTYSDLLHT